MTGLKDAVYGGEKTEESEDILGYSIPDMEPDQLTFDEEEEYIPAAEPVTEDEPAYDEDVPEQEIPYVPDKPETPSEPEIPAVPYTPVVPEETEPEETVETPEDMIRDSMSAVERMKREIAAENESLDRRFAQATAADRQTVHRRRPVYVIGVLSAAASLIFMGIVLVIALLTSPLGAYAAIKLAPVMLIFLGAEIIFAVFRKKTLRIKIDIRSIIVISALIIISTVLSLVSAGSSAGGGERVYTEQRIQNMLASELRDTIARDCIRSVDIETQLFGEDTGMYRTPADLTDGDRINLTVHFSDASMTIREFAKECRGILDDLKKLSYNFGNIYFTAVDKINSYNLNVDWHYQSDYSADRLAGLVNYFGDRISDEDIPDIEDDE